MIAKQVLFCEKRVIIACDAKCDKAWGAGRPRIYLGDASQTIYGDGFCEDAMDIDGVDEDDYVWLADGELGAAPDDVGTWEGGITKPLRVGDRLNKWCCRACERCVMVEENEDFELNDFSQRFYNKQPHTRE